MTASASAKLCAAVHRGAALCNAGAYFEAHEVWEELWRDAHDTPERPTRTLLQGLIQLAAAFHKLHAQRDPASAARILTRAHAKLASVVSTTDAHAHLGIENLAEVTLAIVQAQGALARGAPPPWPRAPELRCAICQSAQS